MHINVNNDLESDDRLAKHFLPHQLAWIEAEKAIHEQGKQAMALAEKSVRIGWTYADAFKNVRKRLWHKNRDYLFATKDYPSALEYVRQCYAFAEIFDLTHAIKRHGEESIKVNRLDENGRPSRFTEEVKMGVIKFDNGSRIIAFSANPQAMAVYGGDVGLDEFAKHPNARLLWETAQGRVTWAYDLAIWSSHDGEDTLFNEFAQEARAGKGPWNIYYKVTLPDAIGNGLVEAINRSRGTKLTREQFLEDCRARARDEEIFQQAYLCNPMGATSNHITEWSAIERCRVDYSIERVHLEAADIVREFGEFNPGREERRKDEIWDFLRANFDRLLNKRQSRFRLGFDVAASGEGDLAVIYVDEANGDVLTLRGLLTCRTEDWHFLKSALLFFLRLLGSVRGAGDESGLGRQICWEVAKAHGGRFTSVNFASKKHDLGFGLMNHLAVAQKRFPRGDHDIAADYFALRKVHTGTRWVFSEGRNALNLASHCDIAWAGALASYAHTHCCKDVGAMVLHDGMNAENAAIWANMSPEERMLWSDDSRIWRRLG